MPDQRGSGACPLRVGRAHRAWRAVLGRCLRDRSARRKGPQPPRGLPSEQQAPTRIRRLLADCPAQGRLINRPEQSPRPRMAGLRHGIRHGHAGWLVRRHQPGNGIGIRHPLLEGRVQVPVVLAVPRRWIRTPLVRTNLQRRTRTLHKLDQRGTGKRHRKRLRSASPTPASESKRPSGPSRSSPPQA